MRLRPIGTGIVVVLEPPDEKSAGGIVLPNAVGPRKGEVVAVGRGRRLDSGGRTELDVKKGDVVYLTRYSDHQVFKIDGREHAVIDESDVLAVVEE